MDTPIYGKYGHKADFEVMIDIETMSAIPTAGIVSIGACKFNYDTGITEEFYRNVEPAGQRELGLDISKSTIEWWKQQDPEVLKQLAHDRVSLKQALTEFAEWYGWTSVPTWSKGASFDLPIMAHAYSKVFGEGSQPPWKYWDGCCARTIELWYPMPEENREGNYHNALDDAKTQAKHLIEFYSKFGML